MTGKERISTTIEHKEPDRVPLDIGAMNVSSISSVLLGKLLNHYGIDETFDSSDIIQRVGDPPPGLKRKIGIDTVRIGPNRIEVPEGFDLTEDVKQVFSLTDSWKVNWEMRPGDHYFHQTTYPLADDGFDSYELPTPDGKLSSYVARRLEEETEWYPLIDRDCAGMFEMSQRLRGMEQVMIDLLTERKKAEQLADMLLEYKFSYWDTLLDQVGDRTVTIAEADDYGTGSSLLISPELIREVYLSRFTQLFTFIRKKAPNARICFHSCGAIAPIIPDLIEAGIDMLNPVQYSAAGMDLATLKREFGDQLVFWGGCVDTTDILPHGTPQQVSDEVKRVLDIMAPGGGFIASAVHNIQGDVPLVNVVALVETIKQYGIY